MKNFKEYAFGASMGQYQPVANLGDFAGKSYYGGLHANAEKKITQSDLDQVEKYADRLFAALGIDVEFTRHFMDRVNDARNIKQITVAELIRLFKQAHRRYGKKIAKMTDQANAVINDMKTDINMPFVIDVDRKGDMELIAKTVMRKKNFTTSASSPKLSFEEFRQVNEEKVPNDDLNWVKTGGSFGKKRRFPTFVVKKEGIKYKAYDEQNNMQMKAASNSLEGCLLYTSPSPRDS